MTFNPPHHEETYMRCHYCDRPATFDIESDGVVVWVCDRHLRERFKDLATTEDTDSLCEKLF